MKIRQLALFALLFLLPSINTQAEETQQNENAIEAILIEGHKTVGTATILEIIKTKPGDKFSTQAVDKDIKNIYQSGYFSDVRVNLQKGTEGFTLAFVVVERPKVKKISFEGNKEIKEEDLKKEIPIAVDKPFSRSKLKESVNKLTSFYKDNGYYFVKVSSRVEEDETVVILKIEEGQKIKIEEINLLGNENFSTFRLKWKMSTGRGDFYKEEELQKDMEKLLFFYKTEGYPLASISPPEVVYDEKKKGIIINISISEGSLFKVEEVKIAGNTVFPTTQLMEEIKTKKGDAYNLAKISLDRQIIKSMYSDKGYALAQILPIPDMDLQRAKANLLFKIEEGVICYIEGIQISGNDKTVEKVIRRELLIKEGEIYDGKKIRQSRQELINLGFFEEVTINTLPGSEEQKRILEVKVKEGKTGNLLFSAGYGERGFVGIIEFTKSNLLGKGWSSNLKAERGEELSNYEFGFTEPWFRDKPTSIGFDVWGKELKENYSNYRLVEKRKGGDIRIGRPWGVHNKVYLNYKYENVQMEVTGTPTIALQQWTDAWGDKYVPASSLSVRLVRNTKKGEDVLNPSSGYYIDLSNEVTGGPLGGKINFCKSILETIWFIPSWWKFTLALHTEMGVVSRLSKEESPPEKSVPAHEKFKIGGPKNLRGYQERSVYPEGTEGGNAFLVGNIEYRFPLTQELHSALFFDFGDSWKGGELKLKCGTGIGVRFKTPVGPITLDYAWRLNDVPRDSRQKKGQAEFHFSIGPPF